MTPPRYRPDDVLDAARAERPKLDARRRERIKAAVITGAAGTAVAASSASAAAGWWTGVSGKVVIGLTAAVVGSGVTYGVMSSVKARSTPATGSPTKVAVARTISAPAPVEVAPLPVVEPVLEQPTLEAPNAMVADHQPVRARVNVAPAPLPVQVVDRPQSEPVESATPPIRDDPPSAEIPRAATKREPEAPRAALDEELVLLQRAMSLHEASDDRAAAEVLGRYDDRFPKGVMRVEALTLRVLVACALGHIEEATSIRRVLEREAPHVLSTPRLQQACAAH